MEIYNVKFKNLQNGKELSSICKAFYCRNKKHMKTRQAKRNVSKNTATLLRNSSFSCLLNKTKYSY